MRTVRRILAQIPVYIVFILVSTIFIGWIFGIATDVPRDKKITLFADVNSMDQTGLSVCLEEKKPEGIKMIRAYTFGYSVFNTDLLESGDVYLVRASEREKYEESFLEITDPALAARFYEGKKGLKVYDAASGEGILKDYLKYENEDYYLFFGAHSRHTGGEESVDGAAFEVVGDLLQIR